MTLVGTRWAGLLTLVLVLSGAGAYAAFDPVGNDGDVDACFERRSGDLDLLKGRTCGKSEKPVAWSQAGPRGPEGPEGPQGPIGPQASTSTVVLGNSDFALPTGAGSSVAFAPSGYTRDPSAVLSAKGLDQITPASVTYLVRDLTASYHAAPGPGDGRTIGLLVNNVEVLSCTVVGSDTDCNSGEATTTVNPRSVLRIRTRNGTTTASPSQGLTWSFRMVDP